MSSASSAIIRTVSSVEAAAILGVHRSLIGRWLRQGRMPGARRIGRDWRIPVESVHRPEPRAPGPKTGKMGKRRKIRAS